MTSAPHETRFVIMMTAVLLAAVVRATHLVLSVPHLNAKGSAIIGVNPIATSEGLTGLSRLAEPENQQGGAFDVVLMARIARRTMGLLVPCCNGVVFSKRVGPRGLVPKLP